MCGVLFKTGVSAVSIRRQQNKAKCR